MSDADSSVDSIDHGSLDVLAADRGLANVSRVLASELESYCKRSGLSLDAMGWQARIDGKNVLVAVGSEGRWLTHEFRAAGERGVRSRWQHRK